MEVVNSKSVLSLLNLMVNYSRLESVVNKTWQSPQGFNSLCKVYFQADCFVPTSYRTICEKREDENDKFTSSYFA